MDVLVLLGKNPGRRDGLQKLPKTEVLELPQASYGGTRLIAADSEIELSLLHFSNFTPIFH